MTVIAGITKQPRETVRQTIDYSYWLNGAVITGLDAVADSPDVSLVAVLDTAKQAASIFITGGVDGSDYTITVTAQVSDTQVREDEIKVRVREVS